MPAPRAEILAGRSTLPAEPQVRWRRAAIAAVGLVVMLVFGTTWLASGRDGVHTIGATSELLIVNDAGPVRVRALDSYDGEPQAVVDGGLIVRTAESWLLREPKVEQLTEGDGSVFRVTCPSRLPCRASIEVFVPSGVALSIVAADDLVQVDAFDGAMSIFAGDGGVVLGSVAGSVSITSTGPVTGARLGPAQLTVDVLDEDVSLTYLDPPTVLAVLGGAGDVTIELPADEEYEIDAGGAETVVGIESETAADRLVSVRSEGTVSIQFSETDGAG